MPRHRYLAILMWFLVAPLALAQEQDTEVKPEAPAADAAADHESSAPVMEAALAEVLDTSESVWNREVFVLDERVFHLSELVRAVLILIAALFAAYLARWISQRTILKRLRQRSERSQTDLDNTLLAIVRATKPVFIFAIALYVALSSLPLSDRLQDGLTSALVVVAVYQAAIWASVAVQRAIDRAKQRRLADDPSSVTAFGLMSFFGKIAVWTAALLIVLDNLGVEITALIAGLGVGGIAVAFALQSILGDIFCSIAILLDKPFVVGDFIIVGDLMGTVENIGIKTTRIRSLGGEQIVFSNADLIGSRIRNYKRMYERRVVFGFGVVYETPVEELEAIPKIVKEIVTAIDKTRFDRAHFKEYGDFSLNFEVVYYVLVADFNEYMDIQQRINLEIFRTFAARGIAFAYPTQELIVRPNGSAGAKDRQHATAPDSPR